MFVHLFEVLLFSSEPGAGLGTGDVAEKWTLTLSSMTCSLMRNIMNQVREAATEVSTRDCGLHSSLLGGQRRLLWERTHFFDTSNMTPKPTAEDGSSLGYFQEFTCPIFRPEHTGSTVKSVARQ